MSYLNYKSGNTYALSGTEYIEPNYARYAGTASIANDVKVNSGYLTSLFFPDQEIIRTGSKIVSTSDYPQYFTTGHRGFVIVSYSNDASPTSRCYCFAFWYINSASDYGTQTFSSNGISVSIDNSDGYELQCKLDSGSNKTGLAFVVVTR